MFANKETTGLFLVKFFILKSLKLTGLMGSVGLFLLNCSINLSKIAISLSFVFLLVTKAFINLSKYDAGAFSLVFISLNKLSIVIIVPTLFLCNVSKKLSNSTSFKYEINLI